MTTTYEELRARAQAHQKRVDRELRFFDVPTLARRWGVSANTVRAIDAAVLPFVNVGAGLQRERRRYHPESVAAYESVALRKVG